MEIRSLFGRSEVDLPSVQEIDLRAQYEEVGDKRGITQLLLIMDDVEIILGDARSGLYFEPAGVRALSEGLLKSNLSRTCEVAQNLGLIAQFPHTGRYWPPEEPVWFRKP